MECVSLSLNYSFHYRSTLFLVFISLCDWLYSFPEEGQQASTMKLSYHIDQTSPLFTCLGLLDLYI
uniref:Uncharacterized protein n=1 Tax=Utricularia reniformis TaxID=192314 RepID=A0A1Y0B3S9_9LAMI|nr:hypothetical protein AEK19_MT1915 [Utricularia reniformis]ART32082.1 hypothetical protein AEK19_MT1915 [Utricularia reniformis]